MSQPVDGIGPWSGWGGTALFVLCWLMVSRISALSFPLWVGLMLLGAALCFYGGMRRTKWFLIPGFVALAVTGGWPVLSQGLDVDHRSRC